MLNQTSDVKNNSFTDSGAFGRAITALSSIREADTKVGLEDMTVSFFCSDGCAAGGPVVVAVTGVVGKESVTVMTRWTAKEMEQRASLLLAIARHLRSLGDKS